MATRSGIWLGNPGNQSPSYEQFEVSLLNLGTTIAAVQASVLEFIANYTPSTGGEYNGPEVPSNLLALLARVLPEGGTTGQIPYRTLSGYVWDNPPTSGGSTPSPAPPAPAPAPTAPDDYSNSVAATEAGTADMNAKTAALT